MGVQKFLVYREGKASAMGSLVSRNTTIFYDPNFSSAFRSDMGIVRSESSTLVLAHEVYHAWTNAGFGVKGVVQVGPGSTTQGLSSTEFWAVRYTNLIRGQMRIPYIRTHYRYNGSQVCVEGC